MATGPGIASLMASGSACTNPGPVGPRRDGRGLPARDTKLNRDVALKVLPASVAGDPERLARFRREARVLAALNHPNIAHIHGLEDTSSAPALVMELVAARRWPSARDQSRAGALRHAGHRATDRERPRSGPRAPDHPSRSQAGKYQGARRRDREGPGFRPREGPGVDRLGRRRNADRPRHTGWPRDRLRPPT